MRLISIALAATVAACATPTYTPPPGANVSKDAAECRLEGLKVQAAAGVENAGDVLGARAARLCLEARGYQRGS